MALAVGTVTVTGKIRNVNTVEYFGTIAIGADPLTYAAGGLVTSFNVAGIQSSKPPLWVDIQGIGGYIYRFAVGTTIANGKTMIFCETTVATNAPLLEHTTAAIASGVDTDTIRFRAVFQLR